MPLPVAAFLSSFALWVAENVRTATGIWFSCGHLRGQRVSVGKPGAWYLLQHVAFVKVTVLIRSAMNREAQPVTRALESFAARQRQRR